MIAAVERTLGVNLPRETVAAMRTARAELRISYTRIAEMFGVNHSTAYRTCTGQLHQDAGGPIEVAGPPADAPKPHRCTGCGGKIFGADADCLACRCRREKDWELLVVRWIKETGLIDECRLQRAKREAVLAKIGPMKRPGSEPVVRKRSGMDLAAFMARNMPARRRSA